MPFAILPFLKAFWPIGKYVLLGLAVAGALFWFVEHERGIGAAKELAKEQAATAAESTRRLDAEQRVKDQAEEHAKAVTAMGASYADSIASLAKASHANDSRACLDPAAVGRLRAIDQSGRKSGR